MENSLNENLKQIKENARLLKSFSPEIRNLVSSALGIDVDGLLAFCDNLEKNNKTNDITNPCGNCTSKNCDACYKRRIDNKENEPLHRPSENVIDEKTKTRIHGLVTKYIDTMVKPYATNANITDKTYEAIHSGLYEFASWLLTANNI